MAAEALWLKWRPLSFDVAQVPGLQFEKVPLFTTV